MLKSTYFVKVYFI